MIFSSISLSFDARATFASLFYVPSNTNVGVAPNPNPRTQPCLSGPITCVYKLSIDNGGDDEDSPIWSYQNLLELGLKG